MWRMGGSGRGKKAAGRFIFSSFCFRPIENQNAVLVGHSVFLLGKIIRHISGAEAKHFTLALTVVRCFIDATLRHSLGPGAPREVG